MKRIITLIAALAALCVTSSAQSTSAEFKMRYDNLVKRVGSAGVGVETIIDRWEASYPDDPDMLLSRSLYYLEKSKSVEIVTKSADKFLGEKPVISLKDSLGATVNYFQETFYNDSLYALSSQALDKAIKYAPDRIDLRLEKVTSLTGYEKESPDMASSTLAGLIDYNASAHPQWIYEGEQISEDDFVEVIQMYCYAFFTIGSPTSYEAFRSLSEKMLKYYPSNTDFLANLGSYYLVARKDSKQALKYYNKVLKIKPDDYAAIKNCVLLARNDQNVKLEKKYLPMLAEYGQTDAEKAAAASRLAVLNKKK